MNARDKRQVVALAALAAATLVAVPSALARYEVRWYTIDGGGDMWTAGGNFELSGTIGQPDSGLMAGGDFALAGGFWFEFCFGDLDGDDDIDLADLAQLLANYGLTTGARYEDGDLDGDGDVDLADLAALLAFYGMICE
jgi:hypothetical protein